MSDISPIRGVSLRFVAAYRRIYTRYNLSYIYDSDPGGSNKHAYKCPVSNFAIDK